MQSPYLPGAIVRLGRFAYGALGVWIGGIWYSAYANQRIPPGQKVGPKIVLPGAKAQYPPDRPDRSPAFASAAASSGGGAASPGTQAFLSGGAPGSFKGYNPEPISRTDQGVDFTGSGPVRALFPGVVTHAGLWPGWPGTDGIVYKTARGNIYVMEHFQRGNNPRTGRPWAVGDQIAAGEVLGSVLPGYPWEETGFANAASTGPLTPYGGRADGTPMPGGLAFRKLLGYP